MQSGCIPARRPAGKRCGWQVVRNRAAGAARKEGEKAMSEGRQQEAYQNQSRPPRRLLAKESSGNG